MAKKAKYYAVKKGLRTGLFTSWDETKPLVHNFKGPQFKSFSTKEEALAYLNDNNQNTKNETKSKSEPKEFQTAHQSKYGSLKTPLIKIKDIDEDNTGKTYGVYWCPISKLNFASLGNSIYLNINNNSFSWSFNKAFLFVDVSDNFSFIFDTYSLLQNHMAYRKKCTKGKLKSAFFHRKVPSVEYAYKYLTNTFYELENKYMKEMNINKLSYEGFEKAQKSTIHAYCDGSSDLRSMGKGIYYDLKDLPDEDRKVVARLLKDHGSKPEPIDDENKQTNNIAELAACRHVFDDLLTMYEKLNKISYKKIFRVIIHTDSAYSLFAIEKHVVNLDLKKDTIANKQHIEACMEPYLQLKKFYKENRSEHMFILKWVPGHLNIIGNQKADALAYNALKGTYVYNTVSDISSDEHNTVSSNNSASKIEELSTDSDLDVEIFEKKPLEEDGVFNSRLCQLLKTSFELDNKRQSQNEDNSKILLNNFGNDLDSFKKTYGLDPRSKSTKERFPWIVLKAKLNCKINEFDGLKSITSLKSMKKQYQRDISKLEGQILNCQKSLQSKTAEANQNDVSSVFANIRRLKASLFSKRKSLRVINEYYQHHYQSKSLNIGTKRSINNKDEKEALPLLKRQKRKTDKSGKNAAQDDSNEDYKIIEISSSSE